MQKLQPDGSCLAVLLYFHSLNINKECERVKGASWFAFWFYRSASGRRGGYGWRWGGGGGCAAGVLEDLVLQVWVSRRGGGHQGLSCREQRQRLWLHHRIQYHYTSSIVLVWWVWLDWHGHRQLWCHNNSKIRTRTPELFSTILLKQNFAAAEAGILMKVQIINRNVLKLQKTSLNTTTGYLRSNEDIYMTSTLLDVAPPARLFVKCFFLRAFLLLWVCSSFIFVCSDFVQREKNCVN